MKYLSRFLLMLALAFLAGTSQASASLRCAEVFHESTFFSEAILTDFTQGVRRPTVNFTEKNPGLHGGHRLTIKKDGPWLSVFANFWFDVQGDPRYFLGALGTKAAEFFGFKMVSPDEMLIPDAAEFQGAVDKVNKELLAQGYEPIPIKLVADDLHKAPLGGYIKHFLDDSLPVATSGHHLIHDMSFHTGIIFTPPRLLKVAQQRVRFVENFTEFFLKRHSFSEQAKKDIRKYVRAFLVRGIDNGTGFGNLNAIASQTNDPIIRQQIAALMATKHNSPNKGDFYSWLPSLHLVLGMIDKYEHYDNNLIIYQATLVRESYLLDKYTLNILNKIVTFEGSINTILSRDENDIYFVWKKLKSAMDEFVKTEQGADHDLDLLRVLSPTLNIDLIGTKFYPDPADSKSLKAEFDDRLRQVREAALRAVAQ